MTSRPAITFLIALACVVPIAAGPAPGNWRAETDAWRAKREQTLRAPADLPDAQGHLRLDFNRACNPSCAYNPNTTCPLPVAQNRLRVAIPAGEKRAPHASIS